MSLDAGKVAEIVDNLDVVVFPQANPDGRHHSMTVDPMWRKNRRPVGHGDPHCAAGGGNGPGVDINRNYDFLWDFPSLFSPDAPVQTSTDPCSEVYRGPSAASEPETANVAWLLDRVPSVGYFIDVHSFGEDILYNWGDDDDQTTDPTMNFHNPAFDGKRGIPDSTPGGDPEKYREYLPAADLDDARPPGHRHARRHRGRPRPAVQREGGGRALPHLGHVRRLRVLAQLRRRPQGQGARLHDRVGTPARVDPQELPPRLPGHGADHRGGHRCAARLLLGAGGQARHTRIGTSRRYAAARACPVRLLVCGR